ncbi:hypothetical protein [Streptomyces sp. NPDC092903]|uniref:hypothetical protein n=1 Tax=Streptomyces sp. NPDC092903 TaxID=3366017 RepID=UPI00380C96AC
MPRTQTSKAAPSDVFDTVRDYLKRADYRPGQALPAGLIAHRLALTPKDVDLALTQLASSRHLIHKTSPYGPAFYIPDTGQPAH